MENNNISCPKCKSQNVCYRDGNYSCQECGCEWKLTDNEYAEGKSLLIRNSTIDFLLFQSSENADGVEVMYADETIWCTQDTIGRLFGKSRSTITEHLQNIFNEGELQQDTVCRKFRRTASDGKEYNTQFYNLDAIISVGYRVNSTRATQFRQWATAVLKQFAIRGYAIDRKRMENGKFLLEDYFEHLLAEIREIRLSERRMYQKVTDLYATAIDYNKDAPTTRAFFAMIQNKLHYAIHGHTAAELIVERASAEKEHMGLTTWENAPKGKIVKTDVSIAKNYLNGEELDSLGHVVNAFLDLAEERAKRHIPMTMEDWAKYIDRFLTMDDRELLKNSGSVSAEDAKLFAESEFEKYRIIQDKLFKSDFDNEISSLFDKKE